MKIVFTNHAKERLKQYRQRGLSREDIIIQAKKIPGYNPNSLKFKVRNDKGRPFDLCIKDKGSVRLIMTIIGKDYGKW